MIFFCTEHTGHAVMTSIDGDINNNQPQITISDEYFRTLYILAAFYDFVLFCFVLMLLARLVACLSVMRDIINISTRMLLLLLYYLLDFITNFDLLIFPSFRISCHYSCRTMCHAILQYFAILQKYILYLHNLYTCDSYVRCVCVVWTLAALL